MKNLRKANHATIQLFLLMNFNPEMPIYHIERTLFVFSFSPSSSIIHDFICIFLYFFVHSRQNRTYITYLIHIFNWTLYLQRAVYKVQTFLSYYNCCSENHYITCLNT